MADPTKITIVMKHIKATKNCHRYEAEDEAPVDCIYLQKSALAGREAPSSVVVEVTLP